MGRYIVTIFVALSACNTMSTVPSNNLSVGEALNLTSAGPSPIDNRSILKTLKKDVTIGSTVDPTNGDTGPRAVSVVQTSAGKLEKGQILVCNFDNSSGVAGKGTTIELLNPSPGSKPTTFIQSNSIEGCDGDAIVSGGVCATGMTSGLLDCFAGANFDETRGWRIAEPLGDSYAPPSNASSPAFVFVGNGKPGAIDNVSFGFYGNGTLLEVIKGFDVNKQSGWDALGPSGLMYSCGSPCNGTSAALYVVDGACNAIVAFDDANGLSEKDEVNVGHDCRTFKCLHPKTQCGRLVKAGPPLDRPVAGTLLPNGNLVVADTANNLLVELTPRGRVLDTKAVGSRAEIFGIAASGTDDSNTTLFYADRTTNTLHELER
jgi:hypothetical protein